MNVGELRKLTSNGFRRFKLHLSDGRSFNVFHPEFMRMSHYADSNFLVSCYVADANTGQAKALATTLSMKVAP